MTRGSSSSGRGRRPRKRWIAAALVLVLCTALAAWIWHPFHSVPRLDGAPLADGDLLFIRGDTVRGFAVVRRSDGFPYSHVGILRRENGVFFVLHVTPDGADDFVRKEALADFLHTSDARHAAVYRIGSGEEAAARAHAASDQAERYYEEKRRFDAAFRLSEERDLYCTELVWRAYLAAGTDLSESRRSRAPTFLTRESVLMPEDLLQGGDARLVEVSR